jgi:hypothetical protein
VDAEGEAKSRTTKFNLDSIKENSRNGGIIQDVTEGIINGWNHRQDCITQNRSFRCVIFLLFIEFNQ